LTGWWSSNWTKNRFAKLRCIGVDEFSYRKHHCYMTVVVDHNTKQVIWTGKGRGAETMRQFFDKLGEAAKASIENVTMDMASDYLKAVSEQLPQAQIVFDRFHVQRLVSDALDEVP
jgi:transposase